MKRTPLLVALTIALVLGLAGPAWAATPYKDVSSAGPLTHVYLGDELSCQIRHQADGNTGEFYPSSGIPADCGTLLAVGSTLFSPDFPNHSSSSAAGALGTPFTPVGQTNVSGSGTSGSPYQVVTTVDAGASGLRIIQTDSYVVGEESYRTDIQVSNTGTNAQSAILYRAGDCFLGGSDRGFGIVDTATKSVGCREGVPTENPDVFVPGDRIEQWVPITGGNNYYQAHYSEVWSKIATKGPFDDSCECDTHQDNGAGISWDLDIPAGESVTRSHITTFSPQGQQALTTDKTADSSESPPGGSNGYSITISNPNVAAVQVSSITDTLPNGFAYTADSTSGVTTSNPSVAGQQLTWTGPFSVPGGGSISLDFGVTVATEPGTYMNEASAEAGTVTVVPTGPTAPISVVGEVTIFKQEDESVSEPGAQNGYRITIDNPNDQAVDVNSITDDLPPGFSYVSGSTTGDVTEEPTDVEGTLTWSGDPLVTVPATDSISFHFDVIVSDIPDEYFNDASAEFANEDTASTEEPARIVVEEPPGITKAADDPTSQGGEQNGYSIFITNPSSDGGGEGEGEGVVLDTVVYDSITDKLPDGFTYVPGSTSGLTDEDPDDISGQTLTWDGPFFIPSESTEELHFNVIVSETPGEYDNEASANQTEGESLSTGPTATITVEEPPSIEKEADSATSEVGTQNGYTIFITNPTEQTDTFALDTITYDSITDTLPAGFTYVPGSTSGLTDEDPDVSGQTLTWDGPFNIPSETTESLHFNVTVSGTPGQYFNNASVHEGDSELATGPTAPIDVTATQAPPQAPAQPLPCDPITAEGSPGGDRMIGGIGADRIRSLAGRDIVDTGAGNDEICGGEGGDFLYGRADSDTIRGEGGNDRLFGGLHPDTLYGDAGHDALIGGKGADSFFTQDGVKDCIMTGKGKDTVTGDVGLDLVDPRGGCPPGF